MKKINVIADLDWLEDVATIGTLSYESIRGEMVYQFTYHPNWLKQSPHLILSKELPLVSGPLYKKGNLFDLFQDALPDRWGRRLIDKRERMEADKNHRLPRTLTDIDYLLSIDDNTRMGALRFMSENGDYAGIQDSVTSVPPITHIREFIDLAQLFEKSELDGTTLREQWLYNLYRQGSSLGGARPKANVRDVDGTLYIAKIPSIHDEYDIALWEHFACCLAKEAGILTTPTRVLHLEGQPYHTLLSRRFDRIGDRRIHFASAMTLCGLQDGASADTGNGYLDIVDMLIGNSGIADIHTSLVELYRRVVFNCMIGNHDDHFRNHGFLLTSRGWEWSPIYDVNPTNFTTQSLLINTTSNESSIELLLNSADEYMLDAIEAATIIQQVKSAVSHWRATATRCGISTSEQNRFAARFLC